MKPGNNKRAGEYRRQPSGHSTFHPAPLPPEPPIELTESLQRALSRADRELGRLDGSITTLPNPDLFVAMYVRKEAVLSSQIEGTQSSLQDVLAAEAHLMDAQRPDDVEEVLNYIEALQHGLQRLPTLPVSVRLICEIHEKLLQGTRGGKLTPGQLRKIQNWIGPSGSPIGEASFVPPPPQELPDLLTELEKFLHNDQSLPVLLQIGLAHAQFETIHPFLDGNGRIGRLLIALLLSERDILQKPVLYLSHYFKRHRQRYYDLLQNIRDAGEWEPWLEFFLTGVAEVSAEATETARKILQLREEHRALIAENLGYSAGNGHRILEEMFEHPILSVNRAMKITQTTYAAANALIGRLEDLGLLREITGQKRNRRFRYEPYVQLFDGG